jgi:hypothetical protein
VDQLGTLEGTIGKGSPRKRRKLDIAFRKIAIDEFGEFKKGYPKKGFRKNAHGKNRVGKGTPKKAVMGKIDPLKSEIFGAQVLGDHTLKNFRDHSIGLRCRGGAMEGAGLGSR